MSKYYSEEQIAHSQKVAEKKAANQTTIDRYLSVYHLGFAQAQSRQPSLELNEDQSVVKLSLAQIALLNEAESQLKIDSEDDLNFNQQYRDLMDNVNQQLKDQELDD